MAYKYMQLLSLHIHRSGRKPPCSSAASDRESSGEDYGGGAHKDGNEEHGQEASYGDDARSG